MTTTTTPTPKRTGACVRCLGTGRIHWIEGGAPEMDRCPACGGSGRIPLPPKGGR